MEGIAGYSDLRPLGRGDGMAIFQATPPDGLGVNGPVVLTVLDEAVERHHQITEELQRLASVASPYLVRLVDAGHVEGRVFFAVEDLPRGTLAEPAGELERAGVLKVLADVARGAEALHEVGLAHRAIAPAGVVLHDEGAKLGVIGVSHLVHPGMTVASGASLASVECTDPAVIRGGPAGRPSDIWSLGATLHHALGGRSLYGGPAASDLGTAVHRHLTTRPRVAEGIDPRLAGIVAACTALDPRDRPPTALDVAERLEAL